MQDRVAVCGEVPKTTLAGRVQVRPAGTVSVRVTVPVNPFSADSVIVEVPAEPADICGLGETAPAEIV